jgi:hypothetical protein
MSKQGRKAVVGRGAIAIALFEIATQLGRWADAQSRLANSNERHADLLAETVELQRTESAVRIAALDGVIAARDEAEVARLAAMRSETEWAPAHYLQSDRRALFLTADGRVDPALETIVARKSARILAFKASGPFIVETDRGPMTGVAGDYIVTNHPDDDPGSDLWTISKDRFDATYLVREAPDADS